SQAILPPGGQVAEMRWRGGAQAVGWPLDDLDRAAALLATVGDGCDLRIVSPGGLDVWIPWLRSRGSDRRGERRRRRSVVRRVRPRSQEGPSPSPSHAARLAELEAEAALWRERARTDPVSGLLSERAHIDEAPAGNGHAVIELPDVQAV